MSPGMGGYTSITGAVRKMAAEEGIRGFYKGLYPNLLKVPPSPCLCGRVSLQRCLCVGADFVVGGSEYGGELVYL